MRLTPARAVLQFVLVPSVIVLVGVAVFVLFGWLAYEKHDIRDYVYDLRSGSSQKRWQAAFELSKLVRSKGGELRGTDTVVDLIETYERADGDDEKVRRYLSLVLGEIGDRRARPVLEAGLEDADPKTQLYALWGLARLGDPASVPAIVERLRASREDSGVRKMAAYALGRSGSQEAVDPLTVALEDRAADVRWNAALALAELGSARAVPTLESMLDRRSLAAIPELHGDQARAAMVNAVAALARLRAADSKPLIQRLARGDADLRVRQAAIAALKQWDATP